MHETIKNALCTEICLEQTTSGILPLTVWGKPKLTLKCLKLKTKMKNKQAYLMEVEDQVQLTDLEKKI
jgi:hypothetical protein